MEKKRFNDENYTLSHFYHEVLVVCPSCRGKAIAKANYEEKTARLFCKHCGYNKIVSTTIGKNAAIIMEANAYFKADLWLKTNFKNEEFMAYNYQHLEYLENYIGAGLREHTNRTHFTLLEKLPKFLQIAKNRNSLLKLIAKLKQK